MPSIFGLASAPRVFTRIMKPVVGILRQLGIRIVIYLDYMLIMAQTQKMAKCHATTTINLLESLGFTVNYQKSVLIPSTPKNLDNPLGILTVSEERTTTLVEGFTLLKDCMGKDAFVGPKCLGSIVKMTDNCSELRDALKIVWSQSRLLLRFFNLMEQVWSGCARRKIEFMQIIGPKFYH